MPKSDNLPRVHVFRVLPVNQSNSRPERVKITSEYSGETAIIDYYAGSATNMQDLAADYLASRGFRLSHTCNAPRGCFLMASNFDVPL